jgi:hypothetical protein
MLNIFVRTILSKAASFVIVPNYHKIIILNNIYLDDDYCTKVNSISDRVEKTWKLGKLVSGTHVCFQEPTGYNIQESMRLSSNTSKTDKIGGEL